MFLGRLGGVDLKSSWEEPPGRLQHEARRVRFMLRYVNSRKIERLSNVEWHTARPTRV